MPQLPISLLPEFYGLTPDGKSVDPEVAEALSRAKPLHPDPQSSEEPKTQPQERRASYDPTFRVSQLFGELPRLSPQAQQGIVNGLIGVTLVAAIIGVAFATGVGEAALGVVAVEVGLKALFGGSSQNSPEIA